MTQEQVPKELISLIKINDRGWNLSLFQDKKSTHHLLCGHCNGICCDAVELGCEHNDDDISLYCKECLQFVIRNNGNQCPINNHVAPVLFPNRSSRNTILKSMVICPYSSKYKIRNMACNANIVDTISCDEKEGAVAARNDKGCSWCGSLADLLSTHLLKCTQKNNPSFTANIMMNQLQSTINTQKKEIDQLTAENSMLKFKLNLQNDEIVALKLQIKDLKQQNVEESKQSIGITTDCWDPISAKCTASHLNTPNLTKNDTTVTKTEGGGYDTIFGQKIAVRGKHCWKFKLSKGAGFKIGVWKHKYGAKMSEAVLGRKANHCYVLDTFSARLNIHNQDNKWSKCNTYGNDVKKNGTIWMYLDLNALTLSFTIDGVDYGAAFKNIEKCKYRAAVTLFVKNDKVEMQ